MIIIHELRCASRRLEIDSNNVDRNLYCALEMRKVATNLLECQTPLPVLLEFGRDRFLEVFGGDDVDAGIYQIEAGVRRNLKFQKVDSEETSVPEADLNANAVLSEVHLCRGVALFWKYIRLVLPLLFHE